MASSKHHYYKVITNAAVKALLNKVAYTVDNPVS